MDTELLIKKEADNFRRILEYDFKPDYHLKVKNELESKLYNYDENVDKLIFLYRTLTNIEDLLTAHNKKCKHVNDPENCNINVYFENVKFFTEQEIRRLNPSNEFSILRPNINSNLIKQNLVNLETHPKTSKIYISALDKLNQASYQRNLLDDLRLSMEVLLKDILKMKNL
ncbi:MAG: hypothetical protein IPF75_15535 [Bacteroidetes bacterium]|nr:hypothetical protein [Bacteroidota bacterium]